MSADFSVYLEENAVKKWERAGTRFYLTNHRHFCGYVRLPIRPVKEQGYGGILTYAPVHGGITLAEECPDGAMIYGFDCGHSGDDIDPKVRDVEWVTAETERMAVAVLTAAEFENAYLLADTNEKRAEAIGAYHTKLKSAGVDFVLTDNFGAMINVLFGGL